MDGHTIKKGMIVVIQEGLCGGNPPGAIVKVLSRPGILSDYSVEKTGKTSSEMLENKVLCECSIKNVNSKLIHNKRPVYQELLSDMKPANAKEKKLRLVGQPNIYDEDGFKIF